MSCLGEGFDWVCAKDDDSILVSRINNKARGPLEVLLATFDYYPQKTGDRVIIGKPDQAGFIVNRGESLLGDEVRGPPNEGHYLELEELTLNEISNENNDPMQSPEFVPHVDEKKKAQSRAKELEELRQMNLATLNAVKLDGTDVPTDRDTFHKRQKEQVEERRRNQQVAKEILHSYRADDKYLLEELKKTSSKESRSPTTVPNMQATPAYFTMSEIDDFQRLLKETAAWKNERVRSFEDSHIDSGEVQNLDENHWIDINTIRTVFAQTKTIEEALKSPLPESPRTSQCPVDLESTNLVEGMSRVPDELEGAVVKSGNMKVEPRVNISAPRSEELEESSDIESDESLGRRVGVETSGTIESDNPYEDSIHSHLKDTQGSILAEDDIKSTSGRVGEVEIGMKSNGQPSTARCEVPGVAVDRSGQENLPECVFAFKPDIHDGSPLSMCGNEQSTNPQQQSLKATELAKPSRKSRLSPSDKSDDRPLRTPVASERPAKTPTLKRVPLYCRRPAVEQKKEIGQPCVGRYIPNLHIQRDGCERCLYWASAEEKEKFLEQGHHLRIMMVRGGCERSCAIFPRLADEFPVRLCKKCYFDTHRKNGICKDGKEEQLLWCPPITSLSSISDVTDQKD